ncbi:protein PHLOEM PROTEIN 2-LIKE A1-like [Silene latifolia]|uniref:protein PHLOEM PROTEIN 2-LIKE A1-like n=1 Tax=Silene latifolia TaxID=37657 RepID=UPI003D7831CF
MGNGISRQTQPQPPSHPNKQESLTSQNDVNKVVIPHNKPQEAIKVLPKLPHNCESIIRNSDRPIDKSSPEQLFKQLYAGVYLNGRKKKYWVEKKGNINCFMLFANDLLITWAENASYWHLHNLQTSDHGDITVAQLRNVCWLEVHGKINMSYLTPRVKYQVAYLIKLEETAYGWDVPVNLSLTLPNGIVQQHHQEDLRKYPREEWIRLVVGEFEVPEISQSDVQFSLYEYEGKNWKKGLVIQGAIIAPMV